jgi:hypothetical protein
MQEKQNLTHPELLTEVDPPVLAQDIEPKATTLLDVDEARARLNSIKDETEDDINPNDDFMDNEEYKRRLENIVVNVKFLRGAMLNGINVVSDIYVDQNQIDPKLINLRITIAIDNFEINGVYDISVLKNALLNISHSLPLARGEDPYKKIRLKAEQSLSDENLADKLKEDAQKAKNEDSLAEQGELVDEFNKQANPNHHKFSSYKKFSDSFTRAIELLK